MSRHLTVTSATEPCEIKDLILCQFGAEIQYKEAKECRLRVLDNNIEE